MNRTQFTKAVLKAVEEYNGHSYSLEHEDIDLAALGNALDGWLVLPKTKRMKVGSIVNVKGRTPVTGYFNNMVVLDVTFPRMIKLTYYNHITGLWTVVYFDKRCLEVVE